ncbi:MAG: MogA/MoaB family molybdenum cofactor biosynthesis protein [Lagierella massiliensis]|nr:MogA/MoaB family molybdenum cofactor biosynthesis protein [Lagierella massiliensis]
MFKVGVITVSDKGSRGERVDESGKVISEILERNGFKVEYYNIIPDDLSTIEDELINCCDEIGLDLLLTTGGTGFSPRDVTPEATIKIMTKPAFGIAEAIRMYSLSITKRAMLSRAVSVIRNKTLIVNLPGSPKACRESLEYIIDELDHGLKILLSMEGECGEK